MPFSAEHSARLDHWFEHLAPVGLTWRRSADNVCLLAAVVFRVKGENRGPDAEGNCQAPQAFSGTADRWMWHDSSKQWELNVWINYLLQDGISAFDNPYLSFIHEVVKPKN